MTVNAWYWSKYTYYCGKTAREQDIWVTQDKKKIATPLRYLQPQMEPTESLYLRLTQKFDILTETSNAAHMTRIDR